MTKRTKMESLVLPPELLMEILLRLPVKSLIRCKCVSKSWHSLISDPHFASSHFELAAAPSQRLLLLQQGALEMVSIDHNAPSLNNDSASSVVKLNFSLYRRRPFAVEIIGSCRGLTLVHHHPNFLCIWNPCTGFQREIPSPPIYSFANRPSCPVLRGFGYDPSTNDYLVILAFRTGSRANVTIRMEIFSLRANMWEQLAGSQLEVLNAPSYCFYTLHAGLLFSGAIHWFGYKQSVAAVVIVAFDLKERVFSEIPLPNGYVNNSYFELRVFNGCLSICSAAYRDVPCVIWVMKEYKVQSSWTRGHVDAHDISARYLSPVCLTQSGDVIGINGYTELVKFNYQGEVLERHDCYDEPEKCFRCGRQKKCTCLVRAKKCSVVMHTESLLSLPCDK